MPVKREPNEPLGTCICPICGKDGARVCQQRRAKHKRLFYYFCDGCGCIQPSKEAGQRAIMDTFKPYGADVLGDPPDDDEPDEPIAAEPVPAAAPAPDEPAAPRKSWLGGLLVDDDD